MKHIKKKFLKEIEVNKDQIAKIEESFTPVEYKSSGKTKIPKGYKPLITTDYGTIIESLQVSINNVSYFIPEPDPILIYFNNAYYNFKQIEPSKQELVLTLDAEKPLTEPIKNNLYNYFGLCEGFIIFLFTSLEGYINKSIPENFEFKDVKSNRTEVYNREQIQRHVAFDKKIKTILPQIMQKDFSSHFPNKFRHIQNLKEFRDILIHIKDSKEGHTPYDYIFKKTFSFNYETTLESVRDFFNYYQPNYIEECNCGKDY
jgi:hypothetical protein